MSTIICKRANRIIFQNVSANIVRGENVLIKGDNGSGKTSLLKMLMGLYKPTSGSIFVNGKDINDYDASTFYKEILFISQDELMPNGNIKEYLDISTHSKIDENIFENVRRKVMLNKDINFIENEGASLSGGEKKKILMMKCILSDAPSVIIVDEIDAGMDADTKAIWKEIEDEIKRNRQTIFVKISHIDTNVDGFDHIIYL